MQTFICPEASRVTVVNFDGSESPACAAGQGEWIEHLEPKPWFLYEIPREEVPELLSALILFASVIYVARQVGKAFSGSRRD